MKIAIIGGGIGGLTAALACGQAGYEVSVHERAEEPREVGAGIQVSPNGSKVLHALGLEAAMREVSCLPLRAELRLAFSGALVLETDLGQDIENRYGTPYYHIHRADLHSILLDAVRDRCGAGSVITGHELVGYRQDENCVTATFANGDEVDADVLVGADGIHSKTREILHGPDKPQFTGHVAWRGVVPIEELEHLKLEPIATSWMAPHSHAVTYLLRGGSLVNFVGIKEQHDWQGESWTERGDNRMLLADIKGWHPEVREIAEHIDAPYRWALFVRPPLKTWNDGRVTLLGDACHAMLPYMAQGAVMAIEDAWILASSLKRSASVADGLKQYEKLRLPRTSKVQDIARNNGRLFHTSGTSKRFAVFGAMAIGSRLFPSIVRKRLEWIMSYDPTAV